MDDVIGSFLKTHRETLRPEQVGLPTGGRRRVKGLRREEVALLANVGVSWYTAIEQGKAHPSVSVLRSISDALLMSETDKEYLFHILMDEKNENIITGNEIPFEIKEIINSLEPNPTYLLGINWDIRYWNESADILFSFSDFLKGVENQKVNLLEYFLNPLDRKKKAKDWESKTRTMISRYRADYLKNPKNVQFQRNIDYFKRYDLFKEEWENDSLDIFQNSQKTIIHPILESMEYKLVVLQTPEYQDLKIITFINGK